ncbi:MAG TPA: hypothetical protein VG841_11225 [Caulobacterales bacterium]|nr:hypothetical protein [Caulobacterales bacterium]
MEFPTGHGKASFDAIYLKPDPRDYFAILGSLDYSIPDLAKPILRQLLGAWRQSTGRSATVLDLGSSYGFNAALLRYPLTFDMLRRRYSRPEMMSLTTDHLLRFDARYFEAWPRVSAERIIALDAAEPAVRYATAVGLVDEGIAADFERDPMTPSQARVLSGVDVVFSTGCVGYVGVKTFDALLSAARSPWVISFVLRMYDYEAIEERLARAGLITEKLLSIAFLQRRFRDEGEARHVLGRLAERGLDPTGLESDGLMVAELYVSRPSEAVARASLEELITVTSGRNLNLGPRLVHLVRSGRTDFVGAR